MEEKIGLTKKALTMQRPHRMVERKLHELEMRFTDLFVSPTDSINPSDQESLSKEIEAKVDFLKNLISIEKECHMHENAPSHLANLEDRLNGLDTAFRGWMEGGDFPHKDAPGEITRCSCTRSCFCGEDEEEEGEGENRKDQEEEEGSDVAESECFELEGKEVPRVSDVKRVDEGEVEGDGKEAQGHYRPYFRLVRRIVLLVGVAALAAAGITTWISEVFGGFEEGYFLVPT